MALDEFALIQRHFTRTTAVRLGIGDDAALLDVPAGETLAVTSDTLVAGRHFPDDATPFDIGWKALAVNLSDLAAMGAQPLGVTLALTLPEADDAWLADFARGFFALAEREGVPLIGGDTTRGPLSLTVTALGSVPPALALRRDGAQPGDLLCVSGTVGDAGLGLAVALGHETGAEADALQRLHRPEPRLALGLALRGLATAALDVSDGLAQDLGHLLTASGQRGARLALEALPLSSALRARPWRQAVDWALTAGDDYELLFTVPAARRADLAALPTPVTVMGEILAEAGLHVTWMGRTWEHALPAGFRHFYAMPQDDR